MGGSYASIGHVVYEEDIFCRFPSSLASISACSSATRLVSKRISGDEEEPGAAASEKRSAIALSLLLDFEEVLLSLLLDFESQIVFAMHA